MTGDMKTILVTGASSGLGKDVTEMLESRAALAGVSVCMLKAGRNSEDDFPYDLNNTSIDIDLSMFDILFHFAWDRSDLSFNCKNVRAIKLLVNEMQGTNARLVLISSVEAGHGNSVYAKQKRICEDLVLAAGGKVLRLGAVVGGGNDFFSQLRKSTSIGPLKLTLVPDPLMDITRIETLANKIVQIILNEKELGIEAVVDNRIRLSDILKMRNHEIKIRVPVWLVKLLLLTGCSLVPKLDVWRDRFLALEKR